jgi:hypothetical protein
MAEDKRRGRGTPTMRRDDSKIQEFQSRNRRRKTDATMNWISEFGGFQASVEISATETRSCDLTWEKD